MKYKATACSRFSVFLLKAFAQCFFDHRARAAFLALSDRCFFVILAARALPPFRPPRRPSSTAKGSFPSLGGVVRLACPVASSTMPLASWLMSGLRERFGMAASLLLAFLLTRVILNKHKEPSSR